MQRCSSSYQHSRAERRDDVVFDVETLNFPLISLSPNDHHLITACDCPEVQQECRQHIMTCSDGRLQPSNHTPFDIVGMIVVQFIVCDTSDRRLAEAIDLEIEDQTLIISLVDGVDVWVRIPMYATSPVWVAGRTKGQRAHPHINAQPCVQLQHT